MTEGQTIADVLEGRADWIVVTGDCLQVLPTIPAGSVGAVVTDPPYEAEAHTQQRRKLGLANGDGREIVKAPLDFHAITEAERDAASAECARVSTCSDCSDCSDCSGCSDCSDCSGCSDCSRCSGCSGCSDCSRCSGCSGCSDCSRCSRCSGMTPSTMGMDIPIIPDIHKAVYAAASIPNALCMSAWHSCETTHCRAGWVVTLAGERGKELERETSTLFAALQIYKASGHPISPVRFFDSDEEAMADMKRLAGGGA